MNIRDIPAGYVPLESFNRDYEKAHFRFSETNRRVGLATRELFVSWFPKLAAPLVRKVIHALLDDPLIGAFGFDPPLHRARRLVSGALGLRGVIAGLLPPRRELRLRTKMRYPSYPNGYVIEDLGPRQN